MNYTIENIQSERWDANVKAAQAHRAWLAALATNTLGQSNEVAKKAYDKRLTALDEYNKCHAEAFRISEIFNSIYKDIAGTDDHLFSKSNVG
jgi:hypothetical protein